MWILRSGIHRLGLRSCCRKTRILTREDVRDWFQKHKKRVQMYRIQADRRRCNGSCCYPAEARRHLRISHMTGRRISEEGFYGKPLVRPNAMAKACGVCDYGDDIELKMPAEITACCPRDANEDEPREDPQYRFRRSRKNARCCKGHHGKGSCSGSEQADGIPVLTENG